MRIPRAISYSAKSKFFKNRDEYFRQYIADERTPREPQGRPASVGSAFDACVKAALYEHFHGKNYKPDEFSYEALFEDQVEPHNRDFADPAGKYVFDCYVKSGMYQRCLDLYTGCVTPPEFQFKVDKNVGGVPITGYPDGWGTKPPNPEPTRIVLDWKVMGFCSNSALSPKPGYLICLDGFEAKKQSKSHMQRHKNCIPRDFNGHEISSQSMEDINEDWAAQCTGYAWCLDETVTEDPQSILKEDFICVIHQVVAKPVKGGGYPLLRFAEYRATVRPSYQRMLHRQYQRVWKAVSSGHIYDEMSRKDSDERCAIRNMVATRMAADANPINPTPHHGFYSEIVRPNWF